ncbi:MAG: hypothetical protein LBC18_02375 [Opitutaceae bacterium]|jgi:hypothetical protein|nr:hypothetical protein [Opitutaceae bacterium]
MEDAYEDQSSFFAPAARTPPEQIDKRASAFEDAPLIRQLLNMTSDAMVIVDEHRQIVFANDNFIPLLAVGDATSIIGLRPGEALGCVHSYTCTGCGTSKQCRECGAVDAILAALDNKTGTGTCTLTRSNKGEVDIYRLHVKSTPFPFNNEHFAVIAFFNITSPKFKKPPDKGMLRDIQEIEKRAMQLRERLLS